ncbi:MAG TPA: hypothetical protein VK625_04510, partial [Flavitalea sp.]|nr:hypothetical protein [Flavitalea sp.]
KYVYNAMSQYFQFVTKAVIKAIINMICTGIQNFAAEPACYLMISNEDGGSANHRGMFTILKCLMVAYLIL